jgi:rapamycin-insensitive companion of mTOR
VRATPLVPKEWLTGIVFGRPLAYQPSDNADVHPEPDRRTNLFTHYKSLILTVLISSGLLDALASIVETSASESQARKATLLLGEILQSAANVLPIDYCTQIQSIPRLVAVASRFDFQQHDNAITSIFQIDSLARTKFRSTLTPPMQAMLDDGGSLGSGAVEQVKLKLGMQIDDAHFRQMILDTQVLLTNNYTKWQWDRIYELFQGPLMNQKRLDESIKGIRLLPKLFGFYRPSKSKFSTIKNTKVRGSLWGRDVLMIAQCCLCEDWMCYVYDASCECRRARLSRRQQTPPRNSL